MSLLSDEIVTAFHEDRVAAAIAVDEVIVTATFDLVITGTAINNVVPALTIEEVVTCAADDCGVAYGTVDGDTFGSECDGQIDLRNVADKRVFIRNLELYASRACFQIAVAVGIELNRGEASS